MRVDAHQHFWRYRHEDYPWIGTDMGILRRNWLSEDLRPLLRTHRFDCAVAVQARASEAETDFLLDLADQHDWIAAVIGWVDLCNDDLPHRLARWADAAQLAGFRHQVQDEANALAFLADPDFRRGVADLQSRSLVYEVLVYARQLPAVPAFCAACDRHWLVLDHLGKPAIRDGSHASWRRDISPLADMAHVVCKISGLVTEAADDSRELDATELCRYLDTALEIFGPQRLMFGSDWPVCQLVAPYAEVVDIVAQWAAGLSASEQDALWGNTAQRIYQLPAPAAARTLGR